MGSRSGSKSDRGYVYEGGVKKITYEDKVNGVVIIRTRFEYKKSRKKRNK